MPSLRSIAIIGAGPSGLMAAEQLAAQGHAVALYDRMPTPARKFLMAGRGGLNLTHSEPRASFLARYGTAAAWLAPAIESFPPEALRAWCDGLGEPTFVGSSGRVFPRSMKAAPLLRAWLTRLQQLGVRYHPRHTWQGWAGDALAFTDANGSPLHITPDATLLALGGASWPRLGSDGGWVPLLAAQGIPIAPLRPANMGFIAPWSPYLSERFAGHPIKPVSLTHHGVTRQGEAMLTARGLEGGVIYALCPQIRDAIEAHGATVIQLDLRPSMSLAALTQKLEIPRANKSFSTYLGKAGFSPLAVALLREVTLPEQLAAYSPAQLAARLKSLPITLTACAAMARAISSAGGILREGVDEQFMLRARPGVFVAGEMLDWEAPTGGYLLQACFSTAVAAGHGMARFLYP